MHSFYLELGGTDAGGYALDVWDGYEITLDMLSPGSPWTFELWRANDDGSTRNAWPELLSRAKLGERVTLAIDGLVLLDGKIRTSDAIGDRNGAKIVISGTDLAGQAMHAGADPTLSLRNTTLQTALERLFEPLGVAIELGEGVDPNATVPALRPPRRPARRPSRRRGVVDRFRPRVGETIWQCADALCRKAGYVLWTAPGSTPDRLVLRVDSPRSSGPARFAFVREIASSERGGSVLVTQRSNIESGHYHRSIDNVPSRVTVFADAPRGDGAAARHARTVENDQYGGDEFSFVQVQQPRYVLSARARTPAAAQREATRLIGDANRNLRSYTLTVLGHGQIVGGQSLLYAPNELAAVRDELLGIEIDGLITRASLRGSRSGAARGQSTQVTVVPRGAIKVEPETP